MLSQETKEMQQEYLDKLYRRHVQGAYVRSGASLIMCFLACVAYFAGVVKSHHIEGISASVLYLILINPPTLFVLRHIKRRDHYKYFSLSINFLEIIGYTAILYFLGGIEAAYLSPIYAAMITYVGMVAPGGVPFIIAGLCSSCFALMVLADYYGLIPHQPVVAGRYNYYPFRDQLAMIGTLSGLLYVVAYISSYTSGLLRKSKERLRRQNKALTEAKRAEERANRSKSEFLANMSHELRTPLNHIIGFTELIVDKKVGELNETQQEYLNDVLDSSNHLLSLINDILDLAKVEADKMELELSDVNLKSLANSSLSMVSQKALRHGIDVSTDLDGVPEIIRADERKLKQILFNLLSNAVKFTPDGGRIALTARRGEVADDFVEISVIDTGVGVRPGDQERVFERFEQADGSFGRRYQGAGLGLHLTKRLVELHGGRIWIESEGEGKGSAFRFTVRTWPSRPKCELLEPLNSSGTECSTRCG
jgi:signal transduction histidine kinase